MKILKLAMTALCSAAVLVVLLAVTDQQQLRSTYLCWKQAVTISSCYNSAPFAFVAKIDGIEYEGNTGNLIDSGIFFRGAWEKPNLFLMRDFMRSIYSGQGTFIDIGANTGQHSLVISRYAKEVHAFEPWEPVLKRFRRMVERNRIKNIAIHAYGLGNDNSKKPFFEPTDHNLGTGSFVDGFLPTNAPAGNLEIQIGDAAFTKERIGSVSVIKMDIEGYEGPALQGLQKTLKQYRPIIVFEITTDPKSPVSIKSTEELLALFPEHYEFLVISERSDDFTGDYFLETIDGLLRFDRREQHDLVAYPSERKNAIPRRGPIR